jgi:hypothetical protein
MKSPFDLYRESPFRKRPYEKPRVLSRESLEVYAATCSQPTSKPDPILCPSGPPQS